MGVRDNKKDVRYAGKAFGGGSYAKTRIIKIVVIFLVGLVTFAAAAILFLYLRPGATSENGQSTEMSEEEAAAAADAEVAKTQAISNDAYKIVENDGYSAVVPWFEKKIEEAPDTYDKVTLYIQLSQTATNNGQLADALKYALKAEELEQSGVTASLVANAAYAAGDKPTALKYYKLTLERITYWIGNEDVYQTYEERIQELEK